MASVTKNAQRSAMRAVLRALSDSQLTSLSTVVCARVAALPQWTASSSVCVYLAMPSSEVRTDALLRQAFDASKRVFVPKVTGSGRNDMVMPEVASMTELDSFPRSSWGIPEPSDHHDRASCTDPAHPVDAVIVPGMAFDSGCHRLGHGKGYYDSFFDTIRRGYAAKGAPMPILIGVCFDEQVIDHVVVDEHDAVLDLVVTPSRVFEREEAEVGRERGK